jgi:hypothetical protein
MPLWFAYVLSDILPIFTLPLSMRHFLSLSPSLPLSLSPSLSLDSRSHELCGHSKKVRRAAACILLTGAHCPKPNSRFHLERTYSLDGKVLEAPHSVNVVLTVRQYPPLVLQAAVCSGRGRKGVSNRILGAQRCAQHFIAAEQLVLSTLLFCLYQPRQNWAYLNALSAFRGKFRIATNSCSRNAFILGVA